MARKSSKFEYDLVPFSQFDLNQPVVQLVEMNDGYQVLLAGVAVDKLEESDSQQERGGIQRNRFDSLRDFLIEEFDAEEGENGELLIEIYRNGEDVEATLEEFFAYLSSEEHDSFMEKGVLVATKITGRYRDPEALFEDFWFGGDEGDEDEGEGDED